MDQSIDTLTLKGILDNLVTSPESIQITRNVDEQGVLISVIVSPQDMPIVIGKKGIMSNSIKTIMRAVGKAHKMNIRVEFLEPDGSSRYSNQNQESEQSPVSTNSLNDDLSDFVISE
jgi:predicted RNA-binding protein YlqC (UPF0109 family)